MSIKSKICGMRDRENILDLSELRPDYMGFIFYPGSRRFVGDLFQIPDELPSAILRVGVFVNQSTVEVLSLVRTHALDIVQLHGSEPARQCQEIGREGVQVIKAFPIVNAFDFRLTSAYAPFVDFMLFDAKGSGFGGNGVAFDWSLLSMQKFQCPFFLSGGIAVENIHNLTKVGNSALHAVDINSGIEASPGWKDTAKARRLLKRLDSINNKKMDE